MASTPQVSPLQVASLVEASDFSAVLGSFLPVEKMERQGGQLYRNYINADPFPHVVVDDFFEPSILDRILVEFPGPQERDWTVSRSKLSLRYEPDIPIFTRHFFYSLNSATFIEFLESVTGMDGLIVDPFFSGGGLHQIMPGGKLPIHSDFNRHDRLKLDRRVNLLLYLNKGWKEEYGGHLELWNRELTECRRRVLPQFNRLVIFGTNDYTYHGHPEPLRCPDGFTRKSLALYYYSNGRPTHELSGKHGTLWQRRPGEVKRLKQTVRDVLKSCVPPIIVKGVRSLYKHRRR